MRKGSMEFWPHRRAKRQMPRVRSWPVVAEPSLLGIVGYKAGMTHVAMVDDSDSPNKGSEVSRAVTVVEMPKLYVYGIRFYKSNIYKEPAAEVYDENAAKKVGIKQTKHNSIDAVKQKLKEFSDVTALVYSDASSLGFGNKRVMRFEVGIGGSSVEDKFAFVEKLIGKEIKAKDVLANGTYIDVTSISKGKGWAGVVKRFHVARQMRKATGKIRHLGTLGAWHPPKVLFTVPHSGHMGYNYRTELNKRVLMVGSESDAKTINVSGGFVNYGSIKNDFVVIDGSIPGPARRLVRMRKALRNKSQAKQPQINYISLASKQGA